MRKKYTWFKKYVKIYAIILFIFVISYTIGKFTGNNKSNIEYEKSNIAKNITQGQRGIFADNIALDGLELTIEEIPDTYGNNYEYSSLAKGMGYYRTQEEIDKLLVIDGAQQWYIGQQINAKYTSFALTTEIVTFNEISKAGRYFDYKTNYNILLTAGEQKDIRSFENLGDANSYAVDPFSKDSYYLRTEVLISNAVFSFIMRFPNEITIEETQKLLILWLRKVENYKKTLN